MFDFSLIIHSLPLLLEGALITVQITTVSVALGILSGLCICLARIAGKEPFSYLAALYVDFMRGTPLLVQIFMIYFALPTLTGQSIEPLAAAIAACSLNSAAYIAEIFRSGIQSIDPGQMEAARSLGMTWFQTMRSVILPQAFKRVVPLLGNEFIALLKDSSLVSVIGFEELTRRGQLITSGTCASFEIWLAVALLYLLMIFLISRLVAFIERRLKIK